MKNILMGAIVGDVVGSTYEGRNHIAKDKNFTLFESSNRFTDDTVCTIAVADWLINGGDVRKYFRKWCMKYPHAGYGKSFKAWFMNKETDEKMDSFGNGSAMRVSPVAWVSDSLDETLNIAKASAEWTHNHEEGIKGAQATAAAIWLAKNGRTKNEIKKYIEEHFGYSLDKTVEQLKNDGYKFSSWCQSSVPESIICFLDSNSYEETVRNAVYLNGDTDTMAAIGGSIAMAFYGGVPEFMINIVNDRLPNDIKDVIEVFDKKFSS